MEPSQFIRIRNIMGLSQRRLATLLDTSIRSVQAYEQGWRIIPSQIERMLLYLLYQKRLPQSSVKPCWEIKKCPNHWRERCLAWEWQAKGQCWLMNGDYCEGKHHRNWHDKMETCTKCSVFTCVMGDISSL